MIRKKEIVFLVIAFLAIGMMKLELITDMDALGNAVVGITMITCAAWILKPWNIPCSVSGLFFMGAVILMGIEPAAAFSGFTQNAVWTLIPALYFGLALQKSGLGMRIAMRIFGMLPSSWLSIILSWGAIGLVLSLITPSMTVRVSVMIPIALNCCKLFNLEKQSRSSSFLLIYALLMALLPGNGWLTGSLSCPMIQGIYGTIPELAAEITFQTWLKSAFVPVILSTLLTAILLFVFLRPENSLPKEIIRTDLGKISKAELITALVLTGSCVLFFTGSMHKIPTVTICMFAVVILFGSHVISPPEFTTGINWDLIVFFGSGLSMSKVFSVSGVSDWIGNHVAPLLVQLSSRPILFLFILMTGLFVWRFIDVTTLVPTMVILAPVIVKVSAVSGISPLIWSTIFAMAICSTFLSYTNMWTYMAKQISGEYAWSEDHIFRAGSAYYVACMLAIALSIPYWISVGYLTL